MNWENCPAVESRQDVHGGAPVVRGTRLTVEDSIIGNWHAGADEEELKRLFPVLKTKSRELRDILSYAQKHLNAPHRV
jgi:uncharacterized protein (DUF433 family)